MIGFYSIVIINQTGIKIRNYSYNNCLFLNITVKSVILSLNLMLIKIIISMKRKNCVNYTVLCWTLERQLLLTLFKWKYYIFLPKYSLYTEQLIKAHQSPASNPFMASHHMQNEICASYLIGWPPTLYSLISFPSLSHQAPARPSSFLFLEHAHLFPSFSPACGILLPQPPPPHNRFSFV